MNKSQDKIMRLSVILVLLLISLSSHAKTAPKSFHEASASELRMLPHFCQSWYKWRKGGEEKAGHDFHMWEKKLGGIPDPQHLCPGLNALNYSYGTTKSEPNHGYSLQSATNELSYVLRRNKSFPIRSTVLLKRGKAFEEWGKLDKAMADYQEAMHIKPKNVHAYISTAELYLKLKNKKGARDIINQGLKVNPTSKALLRWRKKL